MRKSQRGDYHCAPAAAAGPAVMKPFVRDSPAATDAAAWRAALLFKVSGSGPACAMSAFT